jgi:hypothetical protein
MTIPVAIPISGIVPLNTGATTTSTPTNVSLPNSNLATEAETVKSTNENSTLNNINQVDGMNDMLIIDQNESNKLDSLLPIKNKFINNSSNDPLWHDVTICKSNVFVVSEYTLNNAFNEVSSINAEENLIKKQLEPGSAYKFRVAGINACGRGPWSEVSAFVTCVPGYPGAPSSIKISKSGSNAFISWEPPQISCGPIKEYCVYLSVKQQKPEDQSTSTDLNNPNSSSSLSFIQVYCGVDPSCTINADVLAKAYVDTTHKPAILFRIAAKNEKGYGPATQVRWLQQGN